MIIIIIIVIVGYLIYTIIPTVYYKIKTKLKRKKKGNKIYLTFDDGPSHYTKELLDLLKKYNIKASFFLVTSFIKDNEEEVKKIIDDGHLVGTHSFKHESAHLEGIKKTNKDFNKSLAIMNKYHSTIYYRPPWGAINLMTLYNIKKYKLKLILWNTMAEDWKGNITSKEIEEKILNRTKPGDIICLHDARGKNNAPERTIKALENVIPYFLEKGYKFETVDNYEKQ